MVSKKECAELLYSIFGNAIESMQNDPAVYDEWVRNGAWLESDSTDLSPRLRAMGASYQTLTEMGLITTDVEIGDMVGLNIRAILAAKDTQQQTQRG